VKNTLKKSKIISFISDFGYQDNWVATCKAVILSIDPQITIIDITHDIDSYNIFGAAFQLAQTVRYFPISVHLAVVDPGVGSNRRPIAIASKSGHFLVGPDNGVLSLAAESLGGIEKAVQLTNKKYQLRSVSSTFHGRDLFAPAAAYLANGIKIEELGLPIVKESLQTITIPKLVVENQQIKARVIYKDKFGSLTLNLPSSLNEPFSLADYRSLTVIIENNKFQVPMVSSFSQVGLREPLLLVDSFGWYSLAVNQGSAASYFNIDVGSLVTIKAESSKKRAT
jgi:hypothetical protein